MVWVCFVMERNGQEVEKVVFRDAVSQGSRVENGSLVIAATRNLGFVLITVGNRQI